MMALPPPSTIRAVLFDLDGTLRETEPTPRQVFRQVLEAWGVRVPPEVWRDLWRWEHAFWAESPQLRALEARYRTPEGRAPGFWLAYQRLKLQHLGFGPAQAAALAPALLTTMQRHFVHAEDRLRPAARRVLAALRARGYRTGVLTNRRVPLEADYLARLGLADLLDRVWVAVDLGVWKPHRAAFLRPLQDWGLAPQQVVYVGDNYYADVRGARQAGLHAVLLDPDEVFPEVPEPRVRCLDELPTVLSQWNGRKTA